MIAITRHLVCGGCWLVLLPIRIGVAFMVTVMFIVFGLAETVTRLRSWACNSRKEYNQALWTVTRKHWRMTFVDFLIFDRWHALPLEEGPY